MPVGTRVRIAVAAALLLPLAGCWAPLLSEALERARHERARELPSSQAYVQRRLDDASCLQLSEWERAVRREAASAEAFAVLSRNVLADDLARLRRTYASRGCPSRDALLAAGMAPAPGMLAFACVCWKPYGYYPITEPGAGPAGPDCVTVRAELSPGRFAFYERGPYSGERRHEITPDVPIWGSLDRVMFLQLVWGGYASWPDETWTNTDDDGWLDFPIGGIRLLADDCSPLAPDAATVAERTVLRWLDAPTK